MLKTGVPIPMISLVDGLSPSCVGCLDSFAEEIVEWRMPDKYEVLALE